MSKKYFLLAVVGWMIQACSNTPVVSEAPRISGDCGHRCSQAFLLGTRPNVSKTPQDSCGPDCSEGFQLGTHRPKSD